MPFVTSVTIPVKNINFFCFNPFFGYYGVLRSLCDKMACKLLIHKVYDKKLCRLSNQLISKPIMPTQVKIDESWRTQLNTEFEQPYFESLIDFVKKEYAKTTVYPPGKEIFHAFDACHFQDVRVVIIGQDPYHGPGQANGLCFSVRDGVRIPPSLVNIFKEIKNDLGKPIPMSGDLERWARQGVLLLNATLTVQAASPGSHQNKGWEQFTDTVIKKISDVKENVVFLLWGAYAQKKGEIIDRRKHHVLMSAHPSPFSADRGFFGCKHFSKANDYLKSKGLSEIDW